MKTPCTMTASKDEKPGCLSIFFPSLRRTKAEAVSEPLPYRVRDDFLSPAEFSFYKVLMSLMGTHLTIQSKVRLADIFFVARPNENFAYLGKIAQKHVDFLVCDSLTMKPVFGVELDDASHQREDRQERDGFVDQVFQDAGLPLLRFSTRRQYSSREIADQIRPLLGGMASPSTPAGKPEPVAPVGELPNCPKCGIAMVLRTVSKGAHAGKRFYGCRNFPRCRAVKPFFE